MLAKMRWFSLNLVKEWCIYVYYDKKDFKFISITAWVKPCTNIWNIMSQNLRKLSNRCMSHQPQQTCILYCLKRLVNHILCQTQRVTSYLASMKPQLLYTKIFLGTDILDFKISNFGVIEQAVYFAESMLSSMYLYGINIFYFVTHIFFFFFHFLLCEIWKIKLYKTYLV